MSQHCGCLVVLITFFVIGALPGFRTECFFYRTSMGLLPWAFPLYPRYLQAINSSCGFVAVLLAVLRGIGVAVPVSTAVALVFAFVDGVCSHRTEYAVTACALGFHQGQYDCGTFFITGVSVAVSRMVGVAVSAVATVCAAVQLLCSPPHARLQRFQ